MSKPYIYITGASGFIGKNLLRKLQKEKIACYGVSRKKINFKNSIKIKNYQEFMPKNNSVLVHLAENNHVSYILKDDKNLIEFNKNTIRGILEKNWDHVIYISSVLASQKNNKLFYIKNKIECEKIVLDYGGTVLRMTNLYGPNMSKSNIFSDIIKQLRNNNLITLKNTKVKRDFLWVEDAVEAIILSIKKRPKGIYNIASGKSISIMKLAQLFLKNSENNSRKVLSMELKVKEPFINVNIDDTIKDLGWKPRTLLETGIKKLLKID